MVLGNDYRHPVVLAKEAATLDVLTGGRFELGIGAGWMSTDYEAAGIPLDRPGVRIERTTEALAVLRGLWSDEPCTVAGDHYRVTGLDGHPKPLTPGGPPIVIGGGGQRILTLAGREADVVGINVNLAAGVIDREAFWDGTSETTDEKVRWVRAAAGDREPELHVRVHLAMVTDDRDGIVDQLADGFGLTPDQARATPHALVGDVSEICDQLVERRERWGISYLGLSADQLEPFAPVIARLAGT
jgi:probable F420-dependent oxidoreductase